MRPIQLAILGAGSFAQRRILPILHEIPSLQLSALHHRNPQVLDQLQTTYQVPFATTSREELLAYPHIDAVYITSPNDCHEEDALACAQAGKPTLCEKPLAPTVAAILSMIAAFETARVPLFVGQSLRFKWAIHEAKQRLASGQLGELLKIKAYFTLSVPPSNWRYEQARGGGVLQDIGVHLIDFVRFTSGQEIASIFALSSPKEGCDLSVLAIGHLKSGVFYEFECAMNQPLRSGFELYGTQGKLLSMRSLRQTEPSPEKLLWINGQDESSFLSIPRENIYVKELSHFADILQQRAAPLIAANEGLLNQRVIESAYLSIASQQLSFLLD